MFVSALDLVDPAKRLVVADGQAGGLADRVDLAGTVAGGVRGAGLAERCSVDRVRPR